MAAQTYPALPDPSQTFPSVQDAFRVHKQDLELLTGVRGDLSLRALTPANIGDATGAAALQTGIYAALSQLPTSLPSASLPSNMWNDGGLVALTRSDGLYPGPTLGQTVIQRAAGARSNVPAALLVSDGTQGLIFDPNFASGTFNPITQTGDHAIIFTNGTANTGALVIAPWASAAGGIRVDNVGNVFVGTAASISATGRTLSLGGQETVSADSTAGGTTYIVREHTGTIALTGDGGATIANVLVNASLMTTFNLHSSNIEVLNVTNTQFTMRASGNGTDYKQSDIIHESDGVHFRHVNDANSAANDYMVAKRTGYVPTSMLINSAVEVTGNLQLDASIILGGSFFWNGVSGGSASGGGIAPIYISTFIPIIVNGTTYKLALYNN